MSNISICAAPERKYLQGNECIELIDDNVFQGYASLFGVPDQGGDIVQKGAYLKSLARLKESFETVKMLWQHDPTQPIGVWDEIKEDHRGLWVKGRILTKIAKGYEAITLLNANAIDGLSIGYKTIQSERNSKGQRLLYEIELWEISLVTFPMLKDARISAKSNDDADYWRMWSAALHEARQYIAEQ